MTASCTATPRGHANAHIRLELHIGVFTCRPESAETGVEASIEDRNDPRGCSGNGEKYGQSASCKAIFQRGSWNSQRRYPSFSFSSSFSSFVRRFRPSSSMFPGPLIFEDEDEDEHEDEDEDEHEPPDVAEG